MKFYSDNKSAISITHNLVHHDRTKYVEIDGHLLKEKIEEGIISLSHVSTKFHEADIITKLCPERDSNSCRQAGIVDICSPA